MELEDKFMLNLVKLPILRSNVALRVAKGHFATSHSHINYYIDVTEQKTLLSGAQAVAKSMAKQYMHNTVIDTILCLDGMQMVGTCLSEELTRSGIMSINAHRAIHVITPAFTGDHKLLFRDNLLPTLKDKAVLILMASASTGETANSCIEAVNYYGGTVVGLSAIYSASEKAANGMPINALFQVSDLPDYGTYAPNECPMCRRGERIEALVSGSGYSSL